MSTASKIEDILSGFTSISLDEVKGASLMRRRDSKYYFSFIKLPSILPTIREDYSVLEIEGRRTHPYFTAYYDTFNLEMYHKHHRGMATRHKIRIRKYGTSNLYFLEVKTKNAKGITIKNRIKTSGMDASILTKEEKFLSSCSPYANKGIVPVMENSFNRITLVGHNQRERITLDYNLRFSSLLSDSFLDLPGISIAEIKYENLLGGSAINDALRQSHITPRRFSKYAVGMALLNGDLKQNLFKEKVRSVHQINGHYLQSTKPQHYA